MTIVISQSIEFKMEILAKKKRGNIKIIKRLIHQEDLKLIIINTYMFVTTEPQYTLTKTNRTEERNELEIENSTVTVGDFNTLF